jgi:hypothetical protein
MQMGQPPAPPAQQQSLGVPMPLPLGVTFDPKRANYKARIHYDGQERYIGR